jgi:broad specificity phosphatase PhoE
MYICIVRHGQTEWNKARLWQGLTDNPLNETGMAQAAAVGEALKGMSWDAAFSSPLIRAQQTAGQICAACGLEPPTTVAGAFLERDFGRYEGLFIPDNPLDEADPTLEPMEQVRDRMEAALLKLCGEQYGKNIIIASHGRASRALLERLFGVEAVGHLHNCSMSLFEYREGAFRPILINRPPEQFAREKQELGL